MQSSRSIPQKITKPSLIIFSCLAHVIRVFIHQGKKNYFLSALSSWMDLKKISTDWEAFVRVNITINDSTEYCVSRKHIMLALYTRTRLLHFHPERHSNKWLPLPRASVKTSSRQVPNLMVDFNGGGNFHSWLQEWLHKISSWVLKTANVKK